MTRRNSGRVTRYGAKHRWNIPSGWSDSDIFGYDTGRVLEDDEIALDVMDKLYPDRIQSGKKVV